MNILNPIVVYVKNLPESVRLTTYVYICSILTYNLGSGYIESQNALLKYNKIKKGEIVIDKMSYKSINGADYIYDTVLSRCDTKLEAAKFGASNHAFSRMYDSIIWSFSLVSNIIPSIVVFVNKD